MSSNINLPSLDSYASAQRIAPQNARYDRENSKEEDGKEKEKGGTSLSVVANNPIPGATRGSIINMLV